MEKTNADAKKTIEEIMIYEAQFAEKILDRETKKQETILEQASRMQTAFSFVTATIFMALPVIVEYKGKLSYEFLLVAFSMITFFLFVSLVLATYAQKREKIDDYPPISELIKYIEDNYSELSERSQREKYLAETYSKIQKSYGEANKKASDFIHCSMIFFYVALAIAFIFFWIGIKILYF